MYALLELLLVDGLDDAEESGHRLRGNARHLEEPLDAPHLDLVVVRDAHAAVADEAPLLLRSERVAQVLGAGAPVELPENKLEDLVILNASVTRSLSLP